MVDVEFAREDIDFDIIKDEHIIKALSWLERHRDDWFSLRKEATNFIVYGNRFPLEFVVSVAYCIAKIGEYKYATIVGCDSEEMINMLKEKGFIERLELRIFKQESGVTDVSSDYIVKIEAKHVKSALEFLASNKRLKLAEDDNIIYKGNKCPWSRVVKATYWAAKEGTPRLENILEKDHKHDSYRIYDIVEDKVKEIDGCRLCSTQRNNFFYWLEWEPAEDGGGYLKEVDNYVNGIEHLYADLQKNDPSIKYKSIWNIRSTDEVDSLWKDCENNSDLLENEYGIKGLNKYKEFLLDDTSSFHWEVEEELNEFANIGINFDSVKKEHIEKALNYLRNVPDYGKYEAVSHFIVFKNSKIPLKLVLAVAYWIAETSESKIEKLESDTTHYITEFESAEVLNVIRSYNTYDIASILEKKGFAKEIGYEVEIINFDIIKKEHVVKALDWLIGQKWPDWKESYYFVQYKDDMCPLHLVFRAAYWYAVDGRESTEKGEIKWCRIKGMISKIEGFGYNVKKFLRKEFTSWLDEHINASWKVKRMISAADRIYAQWPDHSSDFVWEIDDPNDIVRILEYCDKNPERLEFDDKQYYELGINGMKYYKQFLSNEPWKNDGGEVSVNSEENITGGKSVIFYGVPGSGKSHTIKEMIGKLSGLSKDEFENGKNLEDRYDSLWKKGCIARVVFHPDYTYSDFIGQILPEVVDKIVAYRFRSGPFTRILKKANARPNERFFLIIEEINRGNAAAIFGDLFQLLDRDAKGKSEYNINNKEIYEVVKKNDDVIDNSNNGDDEKNYEICIPPNLWLLATMNTSDQNVFPLDTAFQRRWEMELIRNDFKPTPEFFIGDTGGVTWEKFAKAVNDILGDPSEMASGDKRLGAWFIKRDPKIDDKKFKELFANKVLKYLWDDAFKFNREKFFNAKMKTLEMVIDEFVKCGKDFGNILSDSAKNAIIGKTEGQNG